MYVMQFRNDQLGKVYKVSELCHYPFERKREGEEDRQNRIITKKVYFLTASEYIVQLHYTQ